MGNCKNVSFLSVSTPVDPSSVNRQKLGFPPLESVCLALADTAHQRWLCAGSQCRPPEILSPRLSLETSLLLEQKPPTCWMSRDSWPTKPLHLCRSPTNWQHLQLSSIDFSVLCPPTNHQPSQDYVFQVQRTVQQICGLVSSDK